MTFAVAAGYYGIVICFVTVTLMRLCSGARPPAVVQSSAQLYRNESRSAKKVFR
jgi:hypothetical protein